MPTVRALRSVHLPASVTAVRVLGAGEALLAVAALVTRGPVTPALVALSYAAFAGFVVYARRRGGSISSCGCFGTPDSPPTLAHIVVNATAALMAAAVAFRPGRAAVAELAHSPAAGVPLLLLVAVSTALAYLALAEWPRLAGVLKEGQARA